MGNCANESIVTQPEFKVISVHDLLNAKNKNGEKKAAQVNSKLFRRNTLLSTYYPFKLAHPTQSHDKPVSSKKKVKDKDNTFILQFKDGSEYEGEIDNKKGIPHGLGVFTHKNGDVYEGHFIDGLAEGEGLYKYSDDVLYKGSMLKDFKHGFGCETYHNKDIYHGHFEMGEKTGQGRYDFHNGAYYDGELYCNMKDGKGLLKTEQGEIYNGFWKDDMRHGQGILKLKNGDSYKGEFSNNMKDGYGELREGNTTYKCHFKNDQKVCTENEFDKQKTNLRTRDT